MAILFINEFLRADQFPAHPMVMTESVADQTVAIGAASAQSAAFNATTSIVRVVSDVACSVHFGTNPTATTAKMMLTAGVAEYFYVPKGESYKVAVIANSLGSEGSYSSAVTLTRTADTNAYIANDVIGAATGSTAALEFTNMGPSGGRVIITSVSLEVRVATHPGMTGMRLHMYNVTPPSVYGDNVPWDLLTGDRASYLGFIDLGTPADLGGTLYISTDGVNKQVKLAGTSIFAYLATIGGYTPASATAHVLTLHSIGV